MIGKWIKNKIAQAHTGACDDRGVTAVEFALVAPIFLLFSLGIVDFSRLYWVKNTMQFVVEQTARKAMVDPSLTSSELASFATSEANDLYAGITFTASAQTIGNTQYKTVSASYNFDYNIPFMNLAQTPLIAQARTPVTVTSSTAGTSGNGDNNNGCNSGSSGSGENDGGDGGHHSGGEDGGSHMSSHDSGNDGSPASSHDGGNDNGSHMGSDNGNDGESHVSDDGNESSDANCNGNGNDNSSHDGNESEDDSSSQDGNSSQDDGGDS